MKNSLFQFLFCCSLLVFSSIEELDKNKYVDVQWNSLKASIEKSVQQHLESYLKSQGAPGGCIAIDLNFGEPLYVCAGFSDIAQNISIKYNQNFYRRKFQKTFPQIVVLGILKLIQQNKLTLNDTLDKFFPDLDLPDKNTITIYELLHMSSGLYNYLSGDFYSVDALQKQYTPTELIEYACTKGISYQPGKGYNYCNTNYVILGVIIEQLTGKTYKQFITDTFLTELNLTETLQPTTDILPEPYSKAYLLTSNGDQVVYELNPSGLFATGSMISTVQEMLIWTKALMTGQILDKEAMKELFDFSVPTDFGYFGGGIEKYVGSKLGMKFPAKDIVGKTANILGYTSIMAYDVDDEISLVVFINYESDKEPMLAEEMAMISLGDIKSIIAEIDLLNEFQQN